MMAYIILQNVLLSCIRIAKAKNASTHPCKLLIITISASLLISCSMFSKKKLAPGHNSHRAASGDTFESIGEKRNVAEIPLADKAPPGSQMRLITPKGLNVIYQRVFPKADNGTYGIRCDAYKGDYCETSLFSPGEAQYLKNLDLKHSNFNFDEPNSVTLNYLRYLRAMLSRQCSLLVNREWSAATPESPIKEHVLVKSKANPSAATLDEFLRRLLGIHGLDVTLDGPGAAYAEAFKTATTDKDITNDETIFIENYVATCIALAMDPIVFIY